MRDSQWAALSAALRRGLADSDEEAAPLPRSVDIVRGEMVVPGNQIDHAIVTYLEGNCTLGPPPETTATKTLGWVNRVHGRIEPYIHVGCYELEQMLEPISTGMNQDRRDTVMAEAITRVLLHEWIHIATQNPGHQRDGVAKSAFDLRDLLADDAEFNGKGSPFKPEKDPCCGAVGR